MERLTYRSPEFRNPVSYGACKDVGCDGACDKCKIQEIVSKLCAYEDTELTPEEIITLKSIKAYADAAEHELVKLVQIERQRNEAIEDIPHTCEYCAYNGVDADSAPCADCERLNVLFGDDCWEWRGLKEG